MNAIILCGGKARRFGSDKAFIKIKGGPLIKRQIRILRRIFRRIIIVTNQPHKYRFKKVRIATDAIKNRGPLAGIYSGLLASGSTYTFVVACDMPNINPKLIRYMLKARNSFDVVVPHLAKGYETLFAIYSKKCITPIYETLGSQNLRIRGFFKKVKVREIREDEVKRFGRPDILFMNINTPLDYARFISQKPKRFS